MARNKQNPPGIIKYPFWQMTYQNPKAVYACVNLGEVPFGTSFLHFNFQTVFVKSCFRL